MNSFIHWETTDFSYWNSNKHEFWVVSVWMTSVTLIFTKRHVMTSSVCEKNKTTKKNFDVLYTDVSETSSPSSSSSSAESPLQRMCVRNWLILKEFEMFSIQHLKQTLSTKWASFCEQIIFSNMDIECNDSVKSDCFFWCVNILLLLSCFPQFITCVFMALGMNFETALNVKSEMQIKMSLLTTLTWLTLISVSLDWSI